MEQVNREQKKELEIFSCNENTDFEKQLPAAVVAKSSEPKKKKKKVSNENGSPSLGNAKKRKIPRDADAPKYPKTGK